MLAPLRALLPKSRRGERLVWAALAVFYFAVAGRTYCFVDDAARYVGLAESLVAGEGYSVAGVTRTLFPPGTALAYAPAIALAGRDFAWIHRVSALWSLAAGARAELRRANSAAGALFLTSFALLLVWPYDEGRRFLMPFVPLVLLLGWRGLREIVALARRRSRPVAGLLVALALGAALVGALELSLTARPVGTLDLVALAGWLLAAALGVLARWRAPWRERMASRLRARSAVALWLAVYLALGVPSVTAAVRRNHTPAERHRQAPLRAASLWLAQHAGPGDVVLATTHAPLHFPTGLRVRPLPVTADPARLLAANADDRPRFLVFLDPRPNEYLHPTDAARRRALEHAAPGDWREVHHADGFAILEPAETSTPAR